MYKYETYEDIKATDEFKARWKALENRETWGEYINWILGELALCKEFYDKAPNVRSLLDVIH